MISCASISFGLLCGLVLLLAACGALLWRLGNQSGRSDVQSAFDDYVAKTSQLAAADAFENLMFRR